MSKSKVAVVKCTPETILKDVERVCELGGMGRALAKNRTTILRDNISLRHPFPSANTTPWQMEGVILALQKAGFDDVSCVQSRSVVPRPWEDDDLDDRLPLFTKYAVPALQSTREADMRKVEYRPKARMHVLHKLFPEGILVPDYFFGKNVVHLPTMKTHSATTIAGAMESAAGGLAARRPEMRSQIHRALVDVLAIQKEIHTGAFAVMDGTTAGDGPGPRAVIPVVKDTLLASDDQVAIDAVAAKMMGFDPMALEFIQVAHGDKLGVGDPRDIEIVGDDPDAARSQSWGFEIGDGGARLLRDLVWSGPMRRVQGLVLRSPLSRAFVAGSEAYHDFYRWPLKDKRTFENWKRETTWGRLFSAYERGEADRVTKRVHGGAAAERGAAS